MKEWICLKCHMVFHAGESYAKCCGEIEEFSPAKHGAMLVGSSNSWISVWKEWKDNEKLEEVSRELFEFYGNGSAATALNEFIRRLLIK